VLHQLEEEDEHLTAAYMRVDELRKAAADRLEGTRQEMNRRQAGLANLEKNRSSTVSIWGSEYPEVLKAIQKETRWHHRPIGPIGNLMRLSDNRWAQAVETALVSPSMRIPPPDPPGAIEGGESGFVLMQCIGWAEKLPLGFPCQ
jgi:chromosome segregation ATPase